MQYIKETVTGQFENDWTGTSGVFDCTVVGTFYNMRFVGGPLANSNFVSCTFYSVDFCTDISSTFEGCTFDNCTFGNLVFTGEFKDCNITDTSMHGCRVKLAAIEQLGICINPRPPQFRNTFVGRQPLCLKNYNSLRAEQLRLMHNKRVNKYENSK